jgi:predicted DNA-binding transcriptional regulator YafY
VNQTERLYKIEQMLSESSVVPIETMLERLEISRATFKHDLDYLRDRLHAPIVWGRGLGGCVPFIGRMAMLIIESRIAHGERFVF